MAVIQELHGILGTPDGGDIIHHVRDIMRRLREAEGRSTAVVAQVRPVELTQRD